MFTWPLFEVFYSHKDADALQNELKNNYITTQELSTLSGGFALRCGQLVVFADAALIITKHIDFSGAEQQVEQLPDQSQATSE